MKRTLVVIACSLLLAFGAAGSTADANNEDPRMDVDGLTELESVQVTWSDLFVGLPMESLLGNDAGCDATGATGLHFAEVGTPAAPCSGGLHSFGITHTAMSCLETACAADALDWATFGFIVVACDAGSQAIVDWEAGQVLTLAGACAASGTTAGFSNWDSLGSGGKWSHADNLGDAVVHLLV